MIDDNTFASSLITGSVHVYRLLLNLYPAEFRADYGTLMSQLFRDTARDRVQAWGLIGFVVLWLHTLLDLVKTIPVEHRKEYAMLSHPQPKRISIVFAVILALYWPLQWFMSETWLRIPDIVYNVYFCLLPIFTVLLLREFIKQFAAKRWVKFINYVVFAVACVMFVTSIAMVSIYIWAEAVAGSTYMSLVYEYKQTIDLLDTIFWYNLDMFYLLVILIGVWLIAKRQYITGVCWVFVASPFAVFMLNLRAMPWMDLTVILNTVACLGLSVILYLRRRDAGLDNNLTPA